MKTETLTHYQCGSCEQRWMIGDSTLSENVYCPRCGINQHAINNRVVWNAVLVDGWQASYGDLHCYLHEDGVFSGFMYLVAAHWEPNGMGFDADNLEVAKRIVEKLIIAEASK